MKFFFSMFFAVVGTPLVLEWINRAGPKKIKGIPAWALTIALTSIVAMIVTWLNMDFNVWNFAAIWGLIFMGSHSFFTLIIKKYFPTRSA